MVPIFSLRTLYVVLAVVGIAALALAMLGYYRQVLNREKEIVDEEGASLEKNMSRPWRLTGLGTGLAFLLLAIALARARNNGPSHGMWITSFAILAGVWVVSAAASVALVKRNYDSAKTLLIPASASARECRLLRLVFTVPIYTVVNHLLFLALVSEHFVDNLWGMDYVFDYDTMINPAYLLFCMAALVGGVAGGGFALAFHRDKKWDEGFFWKFTGASAAGGAVGGGFSMVARRYLLSRESVYRV